MLTFLYVATVEYIFYLYCNIVEFMKYEHLMHFVPENGKCNAWIPENCKWMWWQALSRVEDYGAYLSTDIFGDKRNCSGQLSVQYIHL
jgi:hypothetical protein